MLDELIHQLLELCRSIVSGKTPFEEGFRKLRSIVDKHTLGASALFDVLSAVDVECSLLDSSSGANGSAADSSSRIETFQRLLAAVSDNIIPADVLGLELIALGAEENKGKARTRFVKKRTQLYYKQEKFNLLREESEGYAKLITEVLTARPESDQISLIIERLIGQFNLDPNRVIDVILDCFEQNVTEKELFLKILRKFKIHRDELRNIVLLKFMFCQKAEYTPTDLYRVASVLCQADMIDLRSTFAMIAPTQEMIQEENKQLTALVRKRASKAETISTGSLADSSLASATTAMMSNNDSMGGGMTNGPEPPTTNLMSAVSFDMASQTQAVEDRKLAGNAFDDAEVLSKNQKLGLLCALLEHGAWSYAKQLLDRFPEEYPLGKSKYLHWKDNVYRPHESWKRFTHPIEQVTKWEDFSSVLTPLLNYLGPYVAVRHEVAVKIVRLINIFFTEEDVKQLPNYDSLYNTMMNICDGALVPGSSLLDSNFAYCEELWQILQHFPHEKRYWIYGRWKNVHSPRYWDLTIQRAKVLGMTRYAMKRLSKETAKVIGRQLGKLCHTYPLVALDYMLNKVQDFQNFIAPVVDSMRFLSNLAFDVLSYCIIENLSDPDKGQFKTSDGAFSLWLISLSNFSAAVYRRYSIDFSGLLQYIANQLKDGKNLDLIVLREVVANISGVDSNTDITQEHLEALCGGDLLRQEAGYSSFTKINRKAVGRLKDALLRNDLFESLCILISQQKNFIVYKNSSEFPLKLTAQMLDQCQETFVQFFHFLRSNLKPDEYARHVPSVSLLLGKYYMSTETAMCLSRPIYMNKICIAYETTKKNFREDGKKVEDVKTKLNDLQKTSFFKSAFGQTVNMLEEELINSFADTFWEDITSRLYAIFWLLSVNDLIAPTAAYEREIEKCKRELADRTRRNAKEEERLKTLEQKLSEEMRKQVEHVKRIRDILTFEKEVLFASTQNRTSQMLRFLQSCILPRAVFSEVDAIYCAKFIETLHVIRTGFFQTIVFFDKIFTDITPILSGLTERETHCFGRFCNLCLELILRWHSSSAIFEKECEGYPGCLTKIRKRDTDEQTMAAAFSFEYYRSICYKWQARLTKALSSVLASGNYVLIRNGLTLMTKILSHFPILYLNMRVIEKAVSTLRDNEKGKRLDLNLLASSYLVQLAKRNVRLYENKDFFNPKVTKITTSAATSNAASSSNNSNSADTNKDKSGAAINGDAAARVVAPSAEAVAESVATPTRKRPAPMGADGNGTQNNNSGNCSGSQSSAAGAEDHGGGGGHSSSKKKIRE